jgi:hypothetical protein
MLALVGAQTAAATTIDFEAGPLADGTAVSDQLSSPGVRFTVAPPLNGLALPRIVVNAGQAHSPVRGLDLSTNAEEFPTPSEARRARRHRGGRGGDVGFMAVGAQSTATRAVDRSL